MGIALNLLILIVGFFLLIKGADFFEDGSSRIARHIGIPGFVIGLTVVAMGTSAPEAAVSITASIQNQKGNGPYRRFTQRFCIRSLYRVPSYNNYLI